MLYLLPKSGPCSRWSGPLSAPYDTRRLTDVTLLADQNDTRFNAEVIGVENFIDIPFPRVLGSNIHLIEFRDKFLFALERAKSLAPTRIIGNEEEPVVLSLTCGHSLSPFGLSFNSQSLR